MFMLLLICEVVVVGVDSCVMCDELFFLYCGIFIGVCYILWMLMLYVRVFNDLLMGVSYVLVLLMMCKYCD